MPEDQLGLYKRSKRLHMTAGDRDDRGWTPLHIVARKGDLREVRRLLNEGIDANVPAWGPKAQGITPLHLAAKGGHLKIMDELLEHGADIDARTKGACGGSNKLIFILFNPPVHYCPGLEWAYDEMKRLKGDSSSSGGEGSYSSGN
nr:ankyrin repeat and protein kinase domain-containing protein 1-like [Ipomoea batatas]